MMRLSQNPKANVTYLAILPRHRRPKAVPKSSIGWYQQNARMFFEAPGMTAATARQAIADGSLQPTWINGKPVVGYSAETGKPRVESRVSLPQMIEKAESEGGIDSILRIGRTLYSPQWAFRGGRKFNWHEQDLSGFTYDPNPITLGQLQRHLRNHDTFEIAHLQEDYQGVPMGGIVALVQSGRTLAEINSPLTRQLAAALSGRRYRAKKVIEGGMLREADLEWR